MLLNPSIMLAGRASCQGTQSKSVKELEMVMMSSRGQMDKYTDICKAGA